MLKSAVMKQKTIVNFFKSKSTKSKIAICVLLSLPVILYGVGLLKTGNLLVAGDGDYYIQLYEAARTSILDFKQLPWWNPWISGGVPLFANPQFGLISVQTIFTLIFGSIFGYKLALITYLLIGFWGFRKLLVGYFKSDYVHATLLAYIWIFSSFFVYRIGGHFTFFVIGFVPWMIYFFLTRDQGKNWIWLALFSSAIIWSSMHYTTTLSFFVLGLFFLYELVIVAPKVFKIEGIKKKLSKLYTLLSIKNLFLAMLLTTVLSFTRIYATLEYSYDFPRIQNFIKEEPIGLNNTTYALFAPDQYVTPPSEPGWWGWHEISTYIGILTSLVLLIAIYLYFFKTKSSIAKKRSTFILILILFFLLLGQGDFASWAPYTILREFPVFSSMRVATRWINWASIFMLIFIGSIIIKNRKLKNIVTVLLAVTVVELFIVGSTRLGKLYFIEVADLRDSTTFVQYDGWNNKRWGIPYDENFTEATQNNVGQIIAGDSLVDTRQPNSTVRCDESVPPCSYISDNAVVKEWSPNKIVLERTATGPINLNINPGSHWEINGVKNRSYKVVDAKSYFIVYDESQIITIEYSPPYTPFGMIKESLSRIF